MDVREQTKEFVSDVSLSKEFNEPLKDIRGRDFNGSLEIPSIWSLLKGLFTNGVSLSLDLSELGWSLFDRVYASVVEEKMEQERKELKNDLNKKSPSKGRRF